MGRLDVALKNYLRPETRSIVKAVECEAVVGFRHDLDRMTEESMKEWMARDVGIGVPSTLFLLKDQRKWALPDRYELALHSEARPRILPSSVHLYPLVAWRYRANLRRQARRMPNAKGHAPHTVHNYLSASATVNWDTIEFSSIGVGLEYVSSWREMSAQAEGMRMTGEPQRPYDRGYKGRWVRVLPTAWDDKCRRQDSLWDITISMGRCKEQGIPFILNMHPCYADLSLKQLVADKAHDLRMPIKKLIDISREMKPCV